MSLLPKNIPFERAAINNIKTVKDVVRWLNSFIRETDHVYATLHDWLDNITFSDGVEFLAPGNVKGQDGNWRIIVTGVNNDLAFEKRISGVWERGHTMLGDST